MEKAELLRLDEGHAWLWGHWWAALADLTPAQLRHEVGGSFGTVFETAAHMVGAEWAWQGRLEGDPSANLAQAPAAADLAGLKAAWEAVAARRRAYLHSARPDHPVPYSFTGGAATNTVAEVLLHLTSHAHFHRGQLASQFRLLGLKPPSAHYIGFFRL